MFARRRSIQEAASALSVADVKTIEFSGSGQWYPVRSGARRRAARGRSFDVSSYSAAIEFRPGFASACESTRIQTIEPRARQRPAPTEQKLDRYVVGDEGLERRAAAEGAAPGTAPFATPQLAHRRRTPRGNLVDRRRLPESRSIEQRASREPSNGGVEVSFDARRQSYHYAGSMGADNHLEWVQDLDRLAVLGDTFG